MIVTGRDDWPVHQPECFDAPIPGRQWYSACEPGGDWDSELGRYTGGEGPRVRPDGTCESCGARACAECGRENCPDHDHPSRRCMFHGCKRDASGGAVARGNVATADGKLVEVDLYLCEDHAAAIARRALTAVSIGAGPDH